MWIDPWAPSFGMCDARTRVTLEIVQFQFNRPMSSHPFHGGSRPGSGRKSLYGEATKPVRVPESQVENVLIYLESCKKSHFQRALLPGEAVKFDPTPVTWDTPLLHIPVMSCQVPAGFPSPADDCIEGAIDLNQHLICIAKRPLSCACPAGQCATLAYMTATN